ncbi:class E sortase [Microbacterium sp. STN6]|uniref:class E sortase n=1 Tax=Microbacterium sp. STN6 TaxID=2995588 RepID=UPI002260847E|nr:class E sortase [Microbacterium sp. STN6]MCX7522745.1 class E sortase [Microbacterium sp. STN6]
MTDPREPSPGAGERRASARLSVVGLIGELLITAGVLVALFLGWQLWWNNVVSSSAQERAATSQSERWLEQARAEPDASGQAPAPSDNPNAGGTTGGTVSTDPPVMKPAGLYQPFAVIYVPRFGDEWRRVVKEGVSAPHVLNSEHSGIGHYPGTQMPGQVGNFAIAGHVNGYGNAFIDMSKLRLGDRIYIQTSQGWYTYRFRDYEYVQPDAVAVLLPVPREPSTAPEDRLITMTTCNPPFHSGERLVAYGVFESYQPLTAGAPAEIAAHVAAVGG